jgi:hypothetical protein
MIGPMSSASWHAIDVPLESQRRNRLGMDSRGGLQMSGSATASAPSVPIHE